MAANVLRKYTVLLQKHKTIQIIASSLSSKKQPDIH